MITQINALTPETHNAGLIPLDGDESVVLHAFDPKAERPFLAAFDMTPAYARALGVQLIEKAYAVERAALIVAGAFR